MKVSEIGSVVIVSLIPALVYSAVAGDWRAVGNHDVTLVVLALAAAGILVWLGLDEYLVEREVTVEAMKRFGQTFVREFERPLRQSERCRPAHSVAAAGEPRPRPPGNSSVLPAEATAIQTCPITERMCCTT